MFLQKNGLLLTGLVVTLALGLVGCRTEATSHRSFDQPKASQDTLSIRGVTVSCFRDGPGEWDGPGMPGHLETLASLGTNWISIHPYGWISDVGDVRSPKASADDSVIFPTRWARARGLDMMVKPHLGIWRSRFDWRGAIRFEKPEHWERFFEDYQRFIVEQARLAQRGGAGLFVVGTELRGTLEYEVQWRSIIREVRAVYSGQITYAANWDDYRDVPFWDALDAVGIQAYFPLSQTIPPAEAELVEGWRRVIEEIESFADEVSQPIILTELGYARSDAAAVRPWSPAPLGATADQTKLLSLRIALQEIEAAKARGVIRGAFLWKTFVSKRPVTREFALNYPDAFELIERVWATSSANSSGD